MKTHSIVMLAAVLIVLIALPVSADVLYNITDLGSGRAMAISDNRQIVGHCSGRAMLFDPTGGGNNIMLDNQEGVISYASSINDNGQIVGNIEPSPGESSAVIFDPTGEGNHTYLSTPSGFSSCAYSINNNGQIVGYVKSGPSTPPGEFVYVATLFDSTSGDDITYLGPMLPRIGSAALSINDNGQIVGFCRGHATLFDPTGDGNNIDLGTLENRPSIAWSINNSGQIVGSAHGMLGGSPLAILFDPTGEGNNIRLGGGEAKSINDDGEIVGHTLYMIAPMRGHAILFDPTGEGNNINLNNLIDPNLGWELNSAECINNNGWIVGRGRNPDGEAHAFLLKPILPAIEAEIDINPSMLNLQGKGKWISCDIRLGEEYDVADVNSYSIFLEDEIQAEWIWANEQEQFIMAKFSRSALQEMLAELDELGQVELTVSGELTDGTRFEGTDTIRVIDKRHLRRRRVNSNSKVVDSIEYYIQTDKAVYNLGENVEMLYRVTNLRSEEWRLVGFFPIMDMIVGAREGRNFNEIWHWSWNKIHPMGPIVFRLEPRESAEIGGTWPQIDLNGSVEPEDHTQVPRGRYRISGVFSPTDSSIAVDITIVQ